MKILLTSGGTRVPIDRVRHIGNMSNGTFGSKIARELLAEHDDVELVFLYAAHSLTPFSTSIDFVRTSFTDAMIDSEKLYNLYSNSARRYKQIAYRSYEEYATSLESLLKTQEFDVVILAAAVSDYLVANYVDGKIRSSDQHEIVLAEAPKLISKVKSWAPKTKIVGFKLLVNSTDEQLINASKESIEKNKCSLVVANDLRDIMNNNHRLLLVSKVDYYFRTDEFLSDANDPNYLARIVAKRSVNLT